jgi:hypothetical protein
MDAAIKGVYGMNLEKAYKFLKSFVDKFGVRTNHGMNTEFVGYVNWRNGLDIMHSGDFGIEIEFSYPTSKSPSVKPTYTLKKGTMKDVSDLVNRVEMNGAGSRSKRS